MMQHWSRWNEVHLQKESENTRMNLMAHNRQQRVALTVQMFNKIYYFMFSVFVVVTSDRRLRPQTDRPPTLLHPPPYHLSTTTTTTINQTTQSFNSITYTKLCQISSFILIFMEIWIKYEPADDHSYKSLMVWPTTYSFYSYFFKRL